MDALPEENLSDRLRDFIRKEGLTVADLSLEINEKPHRLKDVLRGHQRIPEDLLTKLVKKYALDATWLLTGLGRMYWSDASAISRAHLEGEGQRSAAATRIRSDDRELEFLTVRRFDLRASAGRGSEVLSEIELPPLQFRREWIESELRTKPRFLQCVRCSGDSMSSDIEDGDDLLVDRSQTNVAGGGIYVFRIDNALYLKRLQETAFGLKALSTNTRYETFEISREAPPGDFEICGRVVWFGRCL